MAAKETTMSETSPMLYNNVPLQPSAPPGPSMLYMMPSQQVMGPPTQQPVMQYAIAPISTPQTGGVIMQQTPHGMQPVINEQLLPSDHLILIVVVNIICFLFNVTSLLFGIPAVLFGFFAYTEKRRGRYASIKTYSYAGVIMSFINLAYTGIVSLVIIGLTFQFYCYDGGCY